MRVGHGVARLQVVDGEPMGGYADRRQGVQGLVDPLEVHAVTFADDDHRFALIVADLICVNADIVDRIRASMRPLRVDSCWIAATHTHASPEAGCVPGGSTTPPGLGDRLLTAAVAATKAALADERESAMYAARVQVSGVAGRRNDAAGPADVPIDALVVTSEDTVVGTIVVCPVHPTVLPADNMRVSADLSGGIRRALAAGDRWIVVATGAAGNISTRHTRRDRSWSEVGRLGHVVAEHVQIDALRIDGLVASPLEQARIRPPSTRVVALEPKRPDEVDVALSFKPDQLPSDERTRLVLEQGRRIAADLAARARTEQYRVAIEAVGLGSVTLVAVPAELFLELGEAIRAGASAGSGSAVVVLGYTNGYLGYLAARDTPPTYETLVSPVRRGSGEQLVEAAIALAQEVSSAMPSISSQAPNRTNSRAAP